MTDFDSRSRSDSNGGAGEDLFELALIRPEQLAKLPPCQFNCPGGGDVRGWIGVVAQREKLGLSLDQAYARAWEIIVARNPFPATMGRICPHPCESGCNRKGKDGAVAINALERFLGDWALWQNLSLPLESTEKQPESVAVIGSGPAGLSFAYQMARRGYPVTIYERRDKPGGMLTYGIPEYRLPEGVIDAEIRRILDLGVRLVLGTSVGKDLTMAQLYDRHAVVFLGIGAQKGRLLGVPGEGGEGVWSGTAYLERVNTGRPVALGERVVVIGGGNTAIDAARAARRQGAEVTLLYRRTRSEMPAIAAEVDDALREDVRIEYLSAPLEILREGASVRRVRVQRMELGPADETGRRSPVPIPEAVYEIPADSVIAAVSQEADWEGLEPMIGEGSRAVADGDAWLGEGVVAGGDILGPGVASLAIGQGRAAAEAAHARLRGLPPPGKRADGPINGKAVKPDYYAPAPRTASPRRPEEGWLEKPDEEIDRTIGEGEFLREAGRCFSCGLCMGCEQCMMYCNPRGFTRLEEPRPGTYFLLSLDRCEGCGKCVELCPCGFLSALENPPAGSDR